MMFSCCHPRLPEEAQVALVLHILCGFGVDEVAAAFLGTPAATRSASPGPKRCWPGRGGSSIWPTPTSPRGCRPSTARSTCCSTRATTAPRPSRPCGPSSAGRRCDSRRCSSSTRWRDAGDVRARRADVPSRGAPAGAPRRVGNLSTLADQDRSRWDPALLAEGQRLLERSATGAELTEYHVEAAIAAIHASRGRVEDTDWAQIVALYDTLMTLRPSPVVALNRAIADRAARRSRARARGDPRDRRPGSPRRVSFYFAALGELERRCERLERARASTSAPRSRGRATRWSGASSSSASRRAKAAEPRQPPLPLRSARLESRRRPLSGREVSESTALPAAQLPLGRPVTAA